MKLNDLINRNIFWNAEDEQGAGESQEAEAVAEESTATAEYSESATTGNENAPAPKETDEDEVLFDIEELIQDGDDVDVAALPEVEDKVTTKTKKETEVTPTEDDEEIQSSQQTPDTQKPVGEGEKPTQQEPVKEVVEPQQPAPQPQVAQEAQPQYTPEQQQQMYQEFFDKSVETLAEHVYKFDAATNEAIDTEPSKVLPRLAAQLHMQVMTAAVTQAANMLPDMIGQYLTSKSNAEAIEDKFYGEYQDLASHKDTVNQIAALYVQMNPGVTMEQAAPAIAATARVQLQLPLSSAQGGQAPAQATTASPAQRPVIPTSASGGQSRAPAQSQATVWDELIEEEN